jgi:hypothetical protein
MKRQRCRHRGLADTAFARDEQQAPVDKTQRGQPPKPIRRSLSAAPISM